MNGSCLCGNASTFQLIVTFAAAEEYSTATRKEKKAKFGLDDEAKYKCNRRCSSCDADDRLRD